MKLLNFNEYINEQISPDNNLNDNFWKWFGDSEILDNGKPLICYHGSYDKNFTKFDLNFVGKNTDSGMYGKGFYFTNDIKYATTYNRTNSGRILEVYLNISNPLIINNKYDIPKIVVPHDTLEDMANAATTYSKLFREYLIDNKYDGVIDNTSEIKQFVALYPHQIKSIENDGSWDIEDDNIYS